MERSEAKRFSQFSMLAVLALVALIAMLMVPMSFYFRTLLSRPAAFSTATLMIGSEGADSSKYLAQFDTDSFCQLVLDDPQVRRLAPLSNSPDPRNWLMNHLSVRTVGKNGKLIEIRALGRSERVTSRDLQTLLQTTIEVIRTDAMKTNVPVTVVNTTHFEP